MEKQGEKYLINHLGRIFTTIHYDETLEDSFCNEIRSGFYKKGDFKEVEEQIKKLFNKKVIKFDLFNNKNIRTYNKDYVKINAIINYYILDVIYDAKNKNNTFTINNFMKSNDLIRHAIGKIKNKPNFFDKDLISNLKQFFRIGSVTAKKVSNFPYKTMLDIFERYNTNNNYYDYSCGWGVRLLSSISNEINYHGTDPNHKLVERLNNLTKDHKKITNTNSSVDIRCTGSEVFHPEWEGKMGLVFSSPPYYDLEDYAHGEGQSIKVNESYKEWLENYWRGTVKNIKRYITNDGYFILNIKNIKGYALLDDMETIMKEEGFEYIETFSLKNISKFQHIDNIEPIVVYKKIL